MIALELKKEFLEELELVIRHFDGESNEYTRTHRIIARILNEIEGLSKLEYSYTVNKTLEDYTRPDFILSHKKRQFFIIEAKAALNDVGHKKQILDYLLATDLKYGCLSDGITWNMLILENGTLENDVTLLISEPQKIVDYITSKI